MCVSRLVFLTPPFYGCESLSASSKLISSFFQVIELRFFSRVFLGFGFLQEGSVFLFFSAKNARRPIFMKVLCLSGTLPETSFLRTEPFAYLLGVLTPLSPASFSFLSGFVLPFLNKERALHAHLPMFPVPWSLPARSRGRLTSRFLFGRLVRLFLMSLLNSLDPFADARFGTFEPL